MVRSSFTSTKPRALRTQWAWLFCALLVGFGCLGGFVSAATGESGVACPTYQRVSDVAVILDSRLSEISGLAASRTQPGLLWVHNDSGDQAGVYAIDQQGRTVADVRLIGVEAFDCEDIALGPGPDGSDCLYLADSGDNAAAREAIRIYRFHEPRIEIRDDGQISQLFVEYDVIEAVYPDGPRDAETLLIDPISGDIVIISKDFIRARAYRISPAIDGVATLEFLTEVPWGFMTGGDISPDGASILLRGYWHAEIWPRSTEGDEWWGTLAELGCAVPLAQELQGEAIGFSADGRGYFSISEGIQPSLHFYRILPST